MVDVTAQLTAAGQRAQAAGLPYAGALTPEEAYAVLNCQYCRSVGADGHVARVSKREYACESREERNAERRDAVDQEQRDYAYRITAHVVRLHFLADGFAEEARRAYDKSYDEQSEDDEVTELAGDQAGREHFSKAEDEAADDSSGERAKAADDSRDKCLCRYRAAELRIERVARREEDASDGGENAGNEEDYRDEPVDVDAHKPSCL